MATKENSQAKSQNSSSSKKKKHAADSIRLKAEKDIPSPSYEDPLKEELEPTKLVVQQKRKQKQRQKKQQQTNHSLADTQKSQVRLLMFRARK